MSGKKSNKEIRTQTDFDNLVVQANDTIRLKNTFIGSIDVDQDNVSIIGGGISGGEDISGLTWTDEGSDIWSTPMLTDPKWVNIDGVNAKLAETPSFTLTGTTGTNQLNINHSDVSGYTDIIGSYIVIQEKPWTYSTRYTVTDYNGAGLITLDSDFSSFIDAGDEYKLYNDEQYFVDFNEWIWRDNEIRIKSTVSPSTLNITKSAYDYGVTISGNNCKISGVEFDQQYMYAINNIGNGNSVIGCDIHDVRGTGIKTDTQVENTLIDLNTIYNIGNNGVSCGPVINIDITNNTIYNIGLGSNIGWYNEATVATIRTDGTGIKFNFDLSDNTLDASNIDIQRNIVYNTAYNGISLHIGQTGTIKRNIVYNANQILRDGGCIYCFHFRDTNIPLSGFVIEDNFVTVNTTEVETYGIYMDNRSAGNELTGNVVRMINGNGGIMINADTENHDVNNNTVYTNSDRALWYRDWAAPSKIYNNDQNLINNNILVSRNTSSYPLEFSDSVNPYLNGGSGDNNVYVNPYLAAILNDGSAKTLAQLQSNYTQDANSNALVNYITPSGNPENEILLVENPGDGVLEGTAPSGTWKDVDGTITTNYSVPAWGSLLLLKDLP
jgi:hypothetical protein